MVDESTPNGNGSYQKPDEKYEIALPIQHTIPRGLPVLYVNHMTAQHTEDEFLISFFQIAPPMLSGEPEEQHAQLESLTSVEALCVARFAVTPNLMRRIVRMLSENLSQYDARMQARHQGQKDEDASA